MAKKKKRIIDEEVTATSADFTDSNFMLMDGGEGSKKVPMDTFSTKTEVNSALASKQDVITDLSDIRSGAAAGATAVQPADMTAALTGKENSSNKSQTLNPESTTDFPSSAATASFVNSSVATSTATFRGNFKLPDLGLPYSATDSQIEEAFNTYTWPDGVTPTNNDYVYVEIQNPQTTGIDDMVKRFKYDGSSWHYEYALNNSSFTVAEKAAIDSGIDSAKVDSYDAHVANGDIHVTAAEKESWNTKQNAISDLDSIRSGAQAGTTAVQPGDLGTAAYKDVAASGDASTTQVVMGNDSRLATNIRAMNVDSGKYLCIRIKKGQNHRNASVTLFCGNADYPAIVNIGFVYLTSPSSDETAGFNNGPRYHMVEVNNATSDNYVPNVSYKYDSSTGDGYIYCRWSSVKRLTVLLNTYYPQDIVLSTIDALPTGTTDAQKGHSIPHIDGINVAVGSSTKPVYVNAGGKVEACTYGIAVGYSSNNNTICFY